MSVKDILEWGGGGLIVLLTIIQITPIKINPWSWLAGIIGRAINKDVMDKINVLDEKIDTLDKKTLALEAKADERNAKACRVKILRFGDEILHNVSHSKEHFDQILLDITEYQNYCDTHKDFINHVTVCTTKKIEDTYQHLLDTNGFLK